MKGKYTRTDEIKEKMRKAKLGKKLSQEHKLKIAQSNTGKKASIETKLKMSSSAKLRVGEKSNQWKGDDVGYSGLHYWVYKQLGKPKECENCETIKAKKFEWANISGKYKRDISDWARLCASCHRLFDNTGGKTWNTRRTKGTDLWGQKL